MSGLPYEEAGGTLGNENQDAAPESAAELVEDEVEEEVVRSAFDRR